MPGTVLAVDQTDTETLAVVPGRYRHFKGGYYDVLGTAEDSETSAMLVIYRRSGETAMWARPVGMFLETVVLNGSRVPRFRPVDA
ncbi:DUF1653 domain-containing protein [Herbiconiux ginsengi]|uniref:DUF1653 domain-containing protein n=1 Tax=Herbiconiux ginsengi TaxID=381665 RepID=A0A1H3M5Q6_9MICO|nr:Protein of unknown function [Herbiconiux ginsengi]